MRALALAAIVIATAFIAVVAVADKRSKTDALHRAHIAAWRCTHGRAPCNELSEGRYQVKIESAWNHRERFYVAGFVAGLAGSVLLARSELRRRSARRN